MRILHDQPLHQITRSITKTGTGPVHDLPARWSSRFLDDTAALLIAVAGRRLAPSLHIIARASTWKSARRLAEAGVSEIVRPDLEGGVEIVRRTLVGLTFPEPDVQRYTEIVRREVSNVSPPEPDRVRTPSTIV